MTEPIMERLSTALEGRYRIDRELGEGGMATVFLADDLRHDRKVALKVLKPELAAVVGAERFLAEIKTTANLQHPHILPLFDSGEADGFLFYVMPYVEGESLREKLDREKQLGVEEAIEVAEKVAGALHYAHEQGVVHRDIKPANILMSRGEPLVADFGIALALSEAGGGRITETGLSLGTPHYMSPEQASGDQSLDKRSDVYALGCILYEMLTGEPPYGGPTAQSVLAKILTGDAQRITDLRKTVPPHVDAAVAKALEKLPADRFASAEAFVRALDDEGFRHGSRQVKGPAPGRRAVGAGAVAGQGRMAAAFTVTAAVGLLLGMLLRPSAPPEPVFMADIRFPEGEEVVDVPFGSPVTLSADGETLVYAGPAPDQGWQLWVRRAGALQATPIPGTGSAFGPKLSAGGNTVAFVQGTNLKVVDIAAGTSTTLASDAVWVPDWTRENEIIYLSTSSNHFYRIPAAGGERRVIPALSAATPPGDSTRSPTGTPAGAQPVFGPGDVLPGGETGVWTKVPVSVNETELSIHWLDLESGESRQVASGTSPRYLEDAGYLVWLSTDGTLLAATFDADAGRLTSQPVPIAEGVRTDGQGVAHLALSETGDVVYRAGASQAGTMHMAWVDRAGDTTSVDADWEIRPVQAGNWSGVALSPDGTRAVTTDGAGGGGQLWVKDLESNAPPYRITFDGSFHVRPRWMPGGESVSFISSLGGADVPTQVWAKAADGSGAARQLAASDVEIEEAVVSPDGEWLVYRQGGTAVGRDIYVRRLAEDSASRPLIATDADEKSPQLSPDGRWIAYTSNETGQPEIFVRPFPDVTGGKWQVSLGGGFSPLWANNGNELFYVGTAGPGEPLRMMAARLELRQASLSVSSREAPFTISNHYVDANYTAFDTDPDDERFLMLSFGAGEEGSLVWVRNWVTEWKRRVGE